MEGRSRRPARGRGPAPCSPDLQAPAPRNATPATAPGWPAPTAHRPICSVGAASFRTTRAARETCPRVKSDFFPADTVLADPSLIFPFQNKCCSFHFLK